MFLILVLILISLGLLLKKEHIVRKKYTQESGISYDNAFKDKGMYGEYLTFRELEKIKGTHRIITNVYLPCDNGKTTEIDLIYIHESGIYVIESKNYSGWILGNENDRYWTQVFKNKRKEKFYNPIKQNATHIKSLINVCAIENEFVKSIIVFSKRCTLKNITVHSDNVSVINRNDLVENIKSHIGKSSIKLSEDRINVLYYVLRNYSNVDESVKEAHVENINNYKNRGKSSTNKSTYNKQDDNESNKADYVEYNFKTTYTDFSNNDDNCENTIEKEQQVFSASLEEELKKYRLNKSKELGIKPYMIFSNKEMNDIILIKPIDIDALCKINGFGDVKCSKYGEDIVRIVGGCL